jgi:hypothetical protein
MSRVVSYLDCGCAIHDDGGRTWCPTCEERLLPSAGRDALYAIRRKASNALLYPMKALGAIEAIAAKALEEHD